MEIEGGGTGYVVGLGLAALSNVDRVVGWVRSWREGKAALAASKVDAAQAGINAAAGAVDVMQSVMKVVEARLEASEAECERRITTAIDTIREEWEHERKNLHATIKGLAELLPAEARKRLHPKLQKIIERVAPDGAA